MENDEVNSYWSNRVNDPRSSAELIQLAVNRKEVGRFESELDDPGWQAIYVLRGRASREDFEAVKRLCEGPIPSYRAIGADIIGQFGHPRTYPEETYAILINLLEKNSDPEVLCAAAMAFSHNKECTEALEPLLKLKNHPDENIRYCIVHALCHRTEQRAIDALIELSSDEDGNVRDWATFGLAGLTEVDTPEIRTALYRRIAENDPSNAFEEAVNGLALRKDPRMFPLILEQIKGGDPKAYYLGAAEALADSRLYDPLVALKADVLATVEDPSEYWLHCLDDAIEACKPKD